MQGKDKSVWEARKSKDLLADDFGVFEDEEPEYKEYQE